MHAVKSDLLAASVASELQAAQRPTSPFAKKFEGTAIRKEYGAVKDRRRLKYRRKDVLASARSAMYASDARP